MYKNKSVATQPPYLIMDLFKGLAKKFSDLKMNTCLHFINQLVQLD